MRRLLTALLLLCIIQARAQNNSNSYFNRPDPGNTPELFAKDIVSDQFGNRDMAISPKGDELFYTLQAGNGVVNVIMYSKKQNRKWTAPEVAFFSGYYSDLEPAFSIDGNTLYFSSTRPLTDTGKRKDFDIWTVTKQNEQWGKPKNMGAPVNTAQNEFYASVARNGNIYFTRAVENREEDIMVCRFNKDHYEEAESLPDAINSTGDEFNAFVDPDEKYILFSAYGRSDDMGGGDLYISKKNEQNAWMHAVNLTQINSKWIDYCPYITPDKKYFFFSSGRNNITTPYAQKQTAASLKALLTGALNGSDNIYWMKADAVIGVSSDE